jgi:hypothetical protein
MAYFAEVDENDIVLRVIAVYDKDIKDKGVEKESKGKVFCKNLLPSSGKWIQTSYNGKTRKKFAGIGDYYDSRKNKFISPQPYPSWSLNKEDDWEPPVAHPNDNNNIYTWNEFTVTWEKV